jgi:hypothetical protein
MYYYRLQINWIFLTTIDERSDERERTVANKINVINQ